METTTAGNKRSRDTTGETIEIARGSKERKRDKAEILHEFNDIKHDENFTARNRSPIIGLRRLTNWVKSCMLNSYVYTGASVLDLGCSRGTDLIKYDNIGIGNYVGVDIAMHALEDAVERYNSLPQISFPAKFICEDATQSSVTTALDPTVVFDVTSCQLSIQYAWGSEHDARTFLRNATDRLKPGGYLIGSMPDPTVLMSRLGKNIEEKTIGNSLVQMQFDMKLPEIEQQIERRGHSFDVRYHVSFLEADMFNCPEYVVYFDSLEKLALDYGLELDFYMNYQSMFDVYSSVPTYKRLLSEMKVHVQNLSPDEWDTAGLYCVFAFRKQLGTRVLRKPKLTAADITILRPPITMERQKQISNQRQRRRSRREREETETEQAATAPQEAVAASSGAQASQS